MSPAVRSQLVHSKTPYLDRELQLPRPNAGHADVKWWQAAALGVCLLAKVFRIFFLLGLLVLAIHELGHLAGGLIVGKRFDHIRIGPFKVERPHKFTLHWRWGALFSGGTLTLPFSRSALRSRLFFSTLAGPAANLLSGFLVFRMMPRNESMVAAISQLFVGASFVVGMMNLIPLQRRGTMSDGMTLWVLLFSKARRERLITILTLVADFKQGKKINSLGDYPMKWSSPNDGTAQHVVANWLAYHQAKDDQGASQHLEACLAGCSAVNPDFRSQLIIEAAGHQAARRNRQDLARQWLGLLKSKKKEFGVYWVEVVMLQQEEQFEAAFAMVEEAISYVESLPEDQIRADRLRVLGNLKDTLHKQIAE